MYWCGINWGDDMTGRAALQVYLSMLGDRYGCVAIRTVVCSGDWKGHLEMEIGYLGEREVL